jgi:hypothetical protein
MTPEKVVIHGGRLEIGMLAAGLNEALYQIVTQEDKTIEYEIPGIFAISIQPTGIHLYIDSEQALNANLETVEQRQWNTKTDTTAKRNSSEKDV